MLVMREWLVRREGSLKSKITATWVNGHQFTRTVQREKSTNTVTNRKNILAFFLV
jgi:hypothetical protein